MNTEKSKILIFFLFFFSPACFRKYVALLPFHLKNISQRYIEQWFIVNIFRIRKMCAQAPISRWCFDLLKITAAFCADM